MDYQKASAEVIVFSKGDAIKASGGCGGRCSYTGTGGGGHSCNWWAFWWSLNSADSQSVDF